MKTGNLSSSLQGSVVSSMRPTVLVRVGQQNGQHPAWLLQGLALSGALLSSQTENCSCYIIPLSKNSNGMYIVQGRGCRVPHFHGYDGYIRAKIFASWGKKFGRTCDFAKSIFISFFFRFFFWYFLFQIFSPVVLTPADLWYDSRFPRYCNPDFLWRARGQRRRNCVF